MRILEHGREHTQTLLFFPCTAEPVWAFEAAVTLLSQSWHVFQVIFDGHQPEYPGDFTSVEQTVDEVTEYLKSRGVVRIPRRSHLPAVRAVSEIYEGVVERAKIAPVGS